MIRQIFLGSLMIVGATSIASAAPVEFRGGGFITNLTPECIADGWSEGTYQNIRFRPPNLGTNGVQTSLSLFYSFSAVGYVLASGNLGAKFKNVQGNFIYAQAFPFANQAAIRVTFSQPVSFSNTTTDIVIGGQIKNFGDTANCQVDFRFSLTLKP